MSITNKIVIKEWKYSKVSKVINSNGNTYIEKIVTDPNSNEVEIYDKLLRAIGVEHIPILKTQYCIDKSIMHLEYIDGITCSDNPKAEYLYKAAKKAGNLYAVSSNCIDLLDNNIFHKYNLTKEKLLKHLDVMSGFYETKRLYFLVEKIYDKYENKTCFINHFDMHMKNFIVSDKEFYLIDWATTQITPFYTDLYQLMFEEASDVSADTDLILLEYKKAAGIKSITRCEILEAGICWNITVISWLLDLIGSDTVPFKEWADEQYNQLIMHVNEYQKYS